MANKVKVSINTKKLDKVIEKLQGIIDEPTLIKIGDRIVIEMLADISKGISPIKGMGRFPAYKWAEKVNEVRKKAKAEENKSLRKQLRNWSNEMQKNKYPFTKKAKELGKKPRPVNLKLTGEFLDDLAVFKEDGEIKVGFKKGSLSADKESGHRTGQNEQKKRPIIPNPGETFSSKYGLLIKQILAQTLRIKLR